MILNIYSPLGHTEQPAIYRIINNSENKQNTYTCLADSYRHLTAQNWGGEHELPISMTAISNILHIALQIPGNRGICPGNDGSIGIEYENEKEYVYIEAKENTITAGYQKKGEEIISTTTSNEYFTIVNYINKMSLKIKTNGNVYSV